MVDVDDMMINVWLEDACIVDVYDDDFEQHELNGPDAQDDIDTLWCVLSSMVP